MSLNGEKNLETIRFIKATPTRFIKATAFLACTHAKKHTLHSKYENLKDKINFCIAVLYSISFIYLFFHMHLRQILGYAINSAYINCGMNKVPRMILFI